MSLQFYLFCPQNTFMHGCVILPQNIQEAQVLYTQGKVCILAHKNLYCILSITMTSVFNKLFKLALTRLNAIQVLTVKFVSVVTWWIKKLFPFSTDIMDAVQFLEIQLPLLVIQVICCFSVVHQLILRCKQSFTYCPSYQINIVVQNLILVTWTKLLWQPRQKASKSLSLTLMWTMLSYLTPNDTGHIL